MNPTIALMMQSTARNRGVAGDTINARISPHEAMLLRALGAHGTLNPQTGQRHFAAATDTPAAGPIPQPPQLGGYSLAPLMSQNPGSNLIGNGYGAVPAWAMNPFQLGMTPNFANPNWRFPTGGAFSTPGGMPPQMPASAPLPVKTGVNGGFGNGGFGQNADTGPKGH
jgi:hypothetical protein